MKTTKMPAPLRAGTKVARHAQRRFAQQMVEAVGDDPDSMDLVTSIAWLLAARSRIRRRNN